MGWASGFIAKLKEGETVSFRPRGNSMAGRVESGQLVTVTPLDLDLLRELTVGDIVLCSANGHQYLHLVTGIRKKGDTPISFQIGNNKGGVNGWTPSKNIFGKCIKVES